LRIADPHLELNREFFARFRCTFFSIRTNVSLKTPDFSQLVRPLQIRSRETIRKFTGLQQRVSILLLLAVTLFLVGMELNRPKELIRRPNRRMISLSSWKKRRSVMIRRWIGESPPREKKEGKI
jgi:hypothetical protein